MIADDAVLLVPERASLAAEELQVGERLHRRHEDLEAIVGRDREGVERHLVGGERPAPDQLQHRELAHAEVYTHPLEAQAAAAIAQIPAENTAYLARHGVPVVPPDRRLPPPSRFFGTWYAPAEPDHLIADEDEIPLGDGRSLQVVWTPGHTPGHCCLLLLPERVLFVGDHLLPKITPHVGLWPGGPENPLGDFLGSHEKVQKVDARLVCPAHGAVYEDHRRRARQLIDFHRVRKLAMLELIRRR
ncbi:MAG: MBL fold metallo-hydrolase, partial [Deltaproteobacteria bacterium]